jgi:hypothetical protein
MPVDTKFSIPFLPQEGLTNSILSAIQLANEQHFKQQQIGLQQTAQPSEIAEREATSKRLESQTQLEQMNIQLRREMIGALTGNTPGSQPAQQPATATETQGGVTPTSAPAPGGLIGNTLNKLLDDPSLTSTEQKAISLAGRDAMLKAYLEPDKALDSVVSTYNDILKQKGETARSIKTEVLPDSGSSTGYSMIASSADGKEAYRHPAPPPVPKTLEEASAFFGSTSLNYQKEPTAGNKAALTLAQTQHEAMYRDKIKEVSAQARATAQAQGRDYEAMYRTGKNPITGETLSLANAPPGALVNPTTGQPIPQDMTALYKPTINERQTADTARQVLAISQGLKEQIAKNPNLIGPIAGRNQEALQKMGFSARDASKLIDDVTFLQSAATKMHTGRFSSEILNKMSNVIKPGMNKDEFLGALDSTTDVATRYANEDKLTTVYEFQQRQQHEAQGTAVPKGVIPAGAIPGNLGGKHGYVLNGQFHED